MGRPTDIRLVAGMKQDRRVVYFNGQPTALAGPAQDADHREGHNFYRAWMFRYWQEFKPRTSRPLVDPVTGEVDGRTSYPFRWDPGTKKWDVTRVSEGYIESLRARLTTARDAGRVVMISLFSQHDFRLDREYTDEDEDGEEEVKYQFGWEVCPWNTANNLNGALRVVVRKSTGNNEALRAMYAGLDASITSPAYGDELEGRTTVGEAFDAYVRTIVSRTCDFWNVMYELGNEPQGAPYPQHPDKEVPRALTLAFLSRMAGVIQEVTDGTRLVFHNDLPDGGDLTAWASAHPGTAPYVHGGVVHGVDATRWSPSRFPHRATHVLQVSSDAFRAKVDQSDTLRRDTAAWVRAATEHLLPEDVVFESFSIERETLGAILAATPHPTALLAPETPTGLAAAVDRTTHTLTLSWEPVADADGYRVYRAANEADLATAPPDRELPDGVTSVTFQDPIGWKGFVTVRAFHAGGHNSAMAAVLPVETSWALDAELVAEATTLPTGGEVTQLDRNLRGRATFRNIGWDTWRPRTEDVNGQVSDWGLYVHLGAPTLRAPSSLVLLPLPGEVRPGETVTFEVVEELPYTRQAATVSYGFGRHQHAPGATGRDGAWGHVGRAPTVRVTVPDPIRGATVLVDARGHTAGSGAWVLATQERPTWTLASLATAATAPVGTVIRAGERLRAQGAARVLVLDGPAGLPVDVLAVELEWADFATGRYLIRSVPGGGELDLGARFQERFEVVSARFTTAPAAGEVVLGTVTSAGPTKRWRAEGPACELGVWAEEIHEDLPAGVPNDRIVAGEVVVPAGEVEGFLPLGGDPATHAFYVATLAPTEGTWRHEIVLVAGADGFTRALRVWTDVPATRERRVPARALRVPLDVAVWRAAPLGTAAGDVGARILAAFNAARSWQEVARAVRDNPAFGRASARAYGIRRSLAARILAARDALPGGFTELAQIDAVVGVGIDTNQDILHAFRERPVE